ncbi:hypothetical protein L218DRAFT_954787 [Marasmius fiardii PR-910]|nr:hypothetical protein L218DRAFT_954787 [Marasmius fiardii PR-910]
MAPKKRRLNPPKHSEIEQAHPISQLSDHHSVENTKTVHLPNEIVSLIADEVHDLLPLTLVSRQWYHAAQSRLHWQICVFSGASCKQWSRKFKKFPHLGSFVRVLLLSDPEDDCLGSPYLRGQPAKNLAAALTGLTQLEITNFIRWGPVEQRLVKSFRNLEYLGIGRIPCMNRCKDVPDLVFSYPKLSGLMFYGGVGVGYDHHEAASIVEAGRSLGKQLPPDGKPVQIIDVLSLSNAEICHDQLMWLISPAFDLSKLRILAVRWSDLPAGMPSPPDFSALNALFARVSGTLSVLDLGFPDHEIQHRFPAMARIRDGPDFVSCAFTFPSSLFVNNAPINSTSHSFKMSRLFYCPHRVKTGSLREGTKFTCRFTYHCAPLGNSFGPLSPGYRLQCRR